MRPIPSFALATYTLGPQATINRLQTGTQPAAWKFAVLNHVVLTFEEHPAGGPALGQTRDDLINEAVAALTAAYGSGGDYRKTVVDAVDALTHFAQDIAQDD